MTAMSRSLYLATDAGVTQLELASGRTRFFGGGRARCRIRGRTRCSARRGTVLVGTARGLSRITDTLTRGAARTRLHRAGARAGGGGRQHLDRRGGRPAPAATGGGRSGPHARTRGLCGVACPRGGARVAGRHARGAPPDRLLWRTPGTDSWTLGPMIGGILGRLRAFTLAGDGFFVAGERGVAYVRLRSPLQKSAPRGRLRGRCATSRPTRSSSGWPPSADWCACAWRRILP